MKTKKTTTKECDHQLRAMGEHKVCAICRAQVGFLYTEARLMQNIGFVLDYPVEQYAEFKTKFVDEVALDPSNAIRWKGFDLIVLQYRAELANELKKGVSKGQTMVERKTGIEDHRQSLTAELIKASSFEWDSSTCPFWNQAEKAKRVAQAKTLEAIREILHCFENFEADQALPVLA